MSDNVISIKDFKKPDIGNSNPVILTLYFTPYFNEQNERQSNRISITVENGDYQEIIDVMIEGGGVHAPEPKDGKFWFFPWPPAAISIHVIDAETGEMIELT